QIGIDAGVAELSCPSMRAPLDDGDLFSERHTVQARRAGDLAQQGVIDVVHTERLGDHPLHDLAPLLRHRAPQPLDVPEQELHRPSSSGVSLIPAPATRRTSPVNVTTHASNAIAATTRGSGSRDCQPVASISRIVETAYMPSGKTMLQYCVS